MSKSGVFAHFGSREELQISVVREYHARFEDEVFRPAIAEPRGLPRLRALFERWVRRVSVEIDSGCIYISGAVEFDDRPGPVRDALVAMVHGLADRRWNARSASRSTRATCATPTRARCCSRLHGLILALAPRRAFPAQPRRARPRLGRHLDNVLACRYRPPALRRRARRVADRPFPRSFQELVQMPTYTPPLRDMQFVMHEVLNVVRRAQGAARARRHRRRHPQRRARGGRQVRRRGDVRR